MVTDSKDGWDIDVVYCGYSHDARPGDAGLVPAGPGSYRGDFGRSELLWLPYAAFYRGCHRAMLQCSRTAACATMDFGGRYPGLFRFCMLMPPSRTREARQGLSGEEHG